MPSSSSLVSTTIEISVPDQEFEFYCKFFTKESRRNAEPLPATMARDSISGYSGQSVRNLAYNVPQSAASRSRTSGGGDSASQLPPADSGYGGSIYRAPSEYAASNVTGFRRTLDIPGLPDSSYFTSGASRTDRRPEYIGRSAPRAPSRSHSYTAGQGQELVKYTAGQQPLAEEPDDYDDNDDVTVVPSDSISNVSSRRSARPSQARPAYGYQRSYSYANGESASGYGGSRCSDRPIEYRIVERRPRVC